MLQLTSDERYAYTVNAIREHGEVWCLRDDEGWCLGLDPNRKPTFPVWPHPAYARENAVGDWANYYTESIPLEAFLARAIDVVAEDDYPLAILTINMVWVPVPRPC